MQKKWIIFFILQFFMIKLPAFSQTFRVMVNAKDVSVHDLDPANILYFKEQFYLKNLTKSLLSTDDQGQIFSNLAESWIIEKNKIVFKIDTSIKTNLGKNLSTEDVAASFKRLCLIGHSTHFPIHKYIQGCSQLKRIDDEIAGVRIVDPKTVEIILTEKINDILIKLCHSEFAIIPKSSIDQTNLKIAWEETFGDYYLDSENENEAVLKANPFAKKPIFIQKAHVVKKSSYDENLQKIQNHEVDLAWTTLPSNYDGSILNSNHETVITRKFVYTAVLILNASNSKLQDSSVRQAIRQALSQSQFPQNPILAEKANGIFPKGLWGGTPSCEPSPTVTSPKKLPIPNLKLELTENKLIYEDVKNWIQKSGLPIEIQMASPEDFEKHVANKTFELGLKLTGVSARFPDAYFQYFMKRGYLNDPSHRLKELYDTAITSSPENKDANMTALNCYVLNQAFLVPFIHLKAPIFLNKNYKFQSLEDYSEDIPLANIVPNGSYENF